jgi:hypothetical protein
MVRLVAQYGEPRHRRLAGSLRLADRWCNLPTGACSTGANSTRSRSPTCTPTTTATSSPPSRRCAATRVRASARACWPTRPPPPGLPRSPRTTSSAWRPGHPRAPGHRRRRETRPHRRRPHRVRHARAARGGSRPSALRDWLGLPKRHRRGLVQLRHQPDRRPARRGRRTRSPPRAGQRTPTPPTSSPAPSAAPPATSKPATSPRSRRP